MRSIIVGSAVLLGLSGAALAAPPALLPTNLPGHFTIAPPPPGFDPVRASADALETYGFPPRPSPAQARPYAEWVRAMRAARVRIMPVLEQTHAAAGAALHSHRTAANGIPGLQYSPNWSGMVTQVNVQSFGAGSFIHAAATFNVPIAEEAFGVCNPTGTHLFTWAGIDGWYNNDVLQAGTESNAYCTNGVATTTYHAWYEWWPNLSVVINNLPVVPGDVVSVYVTALGNTQGQALVLNATTNQYVVINFSAPSGTVLTGNTVEWIEERPYWNGPLAILTNYVTAWISGTGGAIGNSWYDFAYPPAGGSSFAVQMHDDSNQIISVPTWIWPNLLVFNDTGSAK